MFIRNVLALCVGLAFVFQAWADESIVRKNFQSRFPGMKIESIARTPFPGLYEVVFDGQVVYTDEKIAYLMNGNLFDLRTTQERNLTQERRDQMATGALASAQGNAVKRVRGNGKRVVYTFEDPNCGYCRELHKELNKMTDVTVYIFLLPILSPDSVEKSKAVWCAKDRSRTWDDQMPRKIATRRSKKMPRWQNVSAFAARRRFIWRTASRLAAFCRPTRSSRRWPPSNNVARFHVVRR